MLLVVAVFFVELVHQTNINKDEHHKYIDRTLLGKPKAEFETSEALLLEAFAQQNAGTKGYAEPYQQQDA